VKDYLGRVFTNMSKYYSRGIKCLANIAVEPISVIETGSLTLFNCSLFAHARVLKLSRDPESRLLCMAVMYKFCLE